MKKILLVFAAVAAVAMVSCKKDPEKGGEKDITGGVDVAKENLVAYLSFDDEKVQKGTDITFGGKKGQAVLKKGIRGKAYCNDGASTDKEAYLTYNLGANNPFKSLKSFTMTCWVKCPAPVNEKPGTGAFFALNGGDGTMGDLMMFREGWGGDALAMKVYLYNAPTVWKGQDLALQNEAFPIDVWFLFGYSYDAATSSIILWSNGVKIGDSIRYAAEKPELGDQPLLGELQLGQDMTKLYIGAWVKQVETTSADGWMGYYPGMVDELRVYNKALTEEEMLALYQAEVKVID